MEVVKKSEENKICVTIYPDGVYPKSSDKVEMPAHVNFNTVEEKEEYVTRELKFVKNQYSSYGGAISTQQRFLARKSLESKRVAFAKSQHFGPILMQKGKKFKQDKYQWYFQGPDAPTESA